MAAATGASRPRATAVTGRLQGASQAGRDCSSHTHPTVSGALDKVGPQDKGNPAPSQGTDPELVQKPEAFREVARVASSQLWMCPSGPAGLWDCLIRSPCALRTPWQEAGIMPRPGALQGREAELGPQLTHVGHVCHKSHVSPECPVGEGEGTGSLWPSVAIGTPTLASGPCQGLLPGSLAAGVKPCRQS